MFFVVFQLKYSQCKTLIRLFVVVLLPFSCEYLLASLSDLVHFIFFTMYNIALLLLWSWSQSAMLIVFVIEIFYFRSFFFKYFFLLLYRCVSYRFLLQFFILFFLIIYVYDRGCRRRAVIQCLLKKYSFFILIQKMFYTKHKSPWMYFLLTT